MSFELIKPGTNIDFIGMRRYAYAFSAILILAGVLSLIFKGGPKYGVDFEGGFNVQIEFSRTVDLSTLREHLESPLLPGLVIQDFGDADRVLLRASFADQSAEQVREAVNEGLSKLPDTEYIIHGLEMVGPKVGADLREKALQAIFYAILLIATYVSGRFEQKWMVSGLMAAGLASVVYVLDLLHAPTSISVIVATIAAFALCFVLRLKYALGAMLSLAHDVIIPLGIFSILNKDVDLNIVAGLLTIVGYSLNDTIIIYDRIRENLRGKTVPAWDVIINQSLNQTLSRTIITTGTTFIAVLALYLFGGAVIHDFALIMLMGILFGVYSSIFISAPILIVFKPEVGEVKSKVKATA
jgi:preprotein translocase subunit SecF